MLKKAISVIAIIICTAAISGCSVHMTTEGEAHSHTYELEGIEAVTVQEIYDMQDKGEEFYLFTGRDSCEKCVIFAEELAWIDASGNEKIYYLDSKKSYDEYGDKEEDLKSFRDKYEIEWVPNFSCFAGEDLKATLEIDDETTEGMSAEDIQKFIETER